MPTLSILQLRSLLDMLSKKPLSCLQNKYSPGQTG